MLARLHTLAFVCGNFGASFVRLWDCMRVLIFIIVKAADQLFWDDLETLKRTFKKFQLKAQCWTDIFSILPTAHCYQGYLWSLAGGTVGVEVAVAVICCGVRQGTDE